MARVPWETFGSAHHTSTMSLGPTVTDSKATLAREPVHLLHRLNLLYLAGLNGLPRSDLLPLLASPSNFHRSRPLQQGTPWRPRADLNC